MRLDQEQRPPRQNDRTGGVSSLLAQQIAHSTFGGEKDVADQEGLQSQSGLEIGEAVVQFAAPEQFPTAIDVCSSEPRIEPDRGIEVGQRGIVLLAGRKGSTSTVASQRIVRGEGQRPVVILESRRHGAAWPSAHRLGAISNRQVRIVQQRPTQVLDRAGLIARLRMDEAAREIRQRHLPIAPDGFIRVGQGVVEIAELTTCLGANGVGESVLGVKFQGNVAVGDGLPV